MKIKTSKLNRVNATVQLMSGVTVKFDKNMEAELEQEDALEAIMARDKSIFLPGQEEAPEVENDETPKETESDAPVDNEDIPAGTETDLDAETGGESNEGDDSPPEEVSMEDELSKLKVNDLTDLCKGSDFPKEEWKDLKKDDLIAYIVDKSASETE